MGTLKHSLGGWAGLSWEWEALHISESFLPDEHHQATEERKKQRSMPHLISGKTSPIKFFRITRGEPKKTFEDIAT